MKSRSKTRVGFCSPSQEDKTKLNQALSRRRMVAPCAFGWATAWLAIGPAVAQHCHRIDFDEAIYPPGTQIDTQYQNQGVTFSITGPDCAGFLPFTNTYPSPPGAHSDGQVLASPFSFGECCTTIDFDEPQNTVQFYVSQNCVRDPCVPVVTITAFDAFGVPVGVVTKTPICGTLVGGGTIPSWEEVNFDHAVCDISTITVCGASCISDHTLAIDALSWGSLSALPIVSLYDPFAPGSPMLTEQVACFGAIDVWGISCDTDGCSHSDILRYRPYPKGGTAGPWTVYNATPVVRSGCPLSAGVLYSIPSLPDPQGWYQLEVVGTDDCGGQAWDNTLICIDKQPPTATIGCPTSGMIVTSLPPHGPLPILGSVNDFCNGVSSWNVSWGVPGGPYNLLASGSGNAGGQLATWNTNTPATPDGPYELVIDATDCVASVQQVVPIVLDNTYPAAQLYGPPPCDYICKDSQIPIYGVAYDLNIERWTLEYSIGGGPWTLIDQGTTNVGSPGHPVLFPLQHPWDLCSLDGNCCYTLRLTVEDKAQSCDSIPNVGNIAVAQQCGNLGKYSDCNGDGVLNFLDRQCFRRDYTSGACPCP